MARILAIDYGTKRVGIAVTDPLQIIASPLDTIENKNIFSFLKNYLDANTVELVIIGFPERSDGSKSEIQDKILNFVSEINKKFTVETKMVDERYTSKLAFRAMIDGGLKKKKRKDKAIIDKISATLLLQEFLNNKK